MDISFKLFEAEDKRDVLEMMTAFNEMYGYDFDLTSREKNLQSFSSDEMLGRLYLIQLHNKKVGYLVLTFGFSFEYKGRDAFIDEFYIQKAYRKQGIGKLTMDFIETEAKRLGVHALHLEVEFDNKRANRLYLNKGYETNNRTLLTKKME